MNTAVIASRTTLPLPMVTPAPYPPTIPSHSSFLSPLAASRCLQHSFLRWQKYVRIRRRKRGRQLVATAFYRDRALWTFWRSWRIAAHYAQQERDRYEWAPSDVALPPCHNLLSDNGFDLTQVMACP